MNPHYQRGSLLYQQGRLELAADELRLALAESADDAHAHALLAQCLSGLGRHAEAEAEAGTAIRLGPDSAYSHYAMALVLSHRNDPLRALAAIREAVRLAPKDPDYLAMQAAFLLELHRPEEALRLAEEALAEDPAHVAGNNLRAMALVRLGRRAEAGATLDASLSREPDNAWTHANRGWGFLHEGNPKQALPHFQEALRLDPDSEWAKAGIVEAIKARNPVYALVLRYILWMGRKSQGAQWAWVVGAYVGYRVLTTLARSTPALRGWVLPLVVAYAAFAWFSWSAVPLSNLMLRLNRFGRLALSPEQLAESNWAGLLVGAAVLFLGMGAVGKVHFTWLVAAGVSAFLMMPVKAVYNCDAGWPRRIMSAYAVLMALLGIAGVGALFLVGIDRGRAEAWAGGGMTILGAYLMGLFLCGWVANGLAMVRVKR